MSIVKFEVRGVVNEDGSWAFLEGCPNGSTAHYTDVMRHLALALEFYSRDPHRRVLTVAERAAIEAERALPEGWTVTNDGVNTNNVDGVPSYSRIYERIESGDGEIGERVKHEAPCGPSGESIPATRAALLALDAAEAA